jgi:hypothetical protein
MIYMAVENLGGLVHTTSPGVLIREVIVSLVLGACDLSVLRPWESSVSRRGALQPCIYVPGAPCVLLHDPCAYVPCALCPCI